MKGDVANGGGPTGRGSKAQLKAAQLPQGWVVVSLSGQRPVGSRFIRNGIAALQAALTLSEPNLGLRHLRCLRPRL